jgi:23S rRNA (adenine2503-C2)-methyltransferase
MGQGEPLLNYDATLAGLRIINATTGLNIGARHITLSTAGIIAGIRRLADETEQFTLAVSLHAAQQELRDQLMPGLRGQKLSDLRMALIEYRNKGGRRVSLEYALIAGGNDRAGDLKALVEFTRGLKAHINLISLNLPKTGKTGKMHSDTPVGEHGLSAASEERMRQVAAELRKAGLEVSIRTKRGADINAACGQLAQR